MIYILLRLSVPAATKPCTDEDMSITIRAGANYVADGQFRSFSSLVSNGENNDSTRHQSTTISAFGLALCQIEITVCATVPAVFTEVRKVTAKLEAKGCYGSADCKDGRCAVQNIGNSEKPKEP